MQQLNIHEISGTAYQCGEAYGDYFAVLIEGFLSQEIPLNNRSKTFANKCLKYIERYAPSSLMFINGMHRTTNIPKDLLILLSLHEEFYHLKPKAPKHCTAIACTQEASKKDEALIGMNWDWPPSYLPWGGLLKMNQEGTPTRLTYHYPGLPACCGLNEEGLAVMWTAGGYYPILTPRPGVPTYIIISELLRRRSVASCLRYLTKCQNAGAFIFLLADPSGKIATIEAVPGRIIISEGTNISHRSCLYKTPEAVKLGKQRTRKQLLASKHDKRVSSLLQSSGRISTSDMKNILCDEKIIDRRIMKSYSLDQFIVRCNHRTLLTKRLNQKWRRFTL